MFKIGIVENFHKDGIKLLENHPNFEYEIIDDVSKENLIKELPKFDGLTLRVAKLGSDILSKCKKLKVISRHGVGYDNVDINHLKKNNITLLITATGNALAVAEHVMYMMLSLSKGVTLYDSEVRSGNFKKNANKIETYELYKKEILIAGFGRIGKNLIKRCLGFDMKVNVFDPFIDESTIKSYGGNIVDNLQTAIKTSDFVSIHMPLNEKTRNLIDAKILKTMKSNAIIINTARGGIVNEVDLHHTLVSKKIRGCGMDVFETEPPEPNHTFFKLDNIIMTPHNAALTLECRKRMSLEAAENIYYFLKDRHGLNKDNLVNLNYL